MAGSYRNEINAVSHSFNKIIFGTAGLKKLEKVYASFHIPSGEDIMAYIKSSVPFMGQLIVVTDCAVYSYLHEAVPISELCQYIIWQADAKASVTMSKADESWDILGGTLIAKNIAGTELVQLIKALQRQLLQNYPWARQQRDTMADRFLDAARCEMRTGQIPAARISLLDTLAQEPAYCEAVTMLEAENIFRTCDQTAYRDFISDLPPDVSESARTVLRDRQERFADAFIQDLSNLSLDFEKSFLESVYSNLAAYTGLPETHCLILAYICARLNKQEQFDRAVEQVRRLGEAKARELAFFRGRYYNARMKRVYDLLKSGEMPPEEWLEWTDSLGLTPLHYAIALHQERLVEQLLEKRTWKSRVFGQDGDEASELMDYTVLACYAGLSNRALVFQQTSDLVAAQMRSRKALERRLWMKQRKLDIQETTIKQAKDILRQARHTDNVPYDRVCELEGKIETASSLREETLLEIDEINQAISDIEYEIRELTEDAMINAADAIQRLRTSGNPLVQYLLRLFSEPSMLLHLLADCQGACRLYIHGTATFVTPADVQINLAYEEESPAQEEKHQEKHSDEQRQWERQTEGKAADEPVVKPYGNSWFSPQAHRDMKKLKEEYHALAKQYHPDKCQHPRSKEIFQEILNERADILEHMN